MEQSPFVVLYGHESGQFGISELDVCPQPGLQSWQSECSVMQQLVHQHLQCAQKRMKQQADMRRSECQFEVGDSVYLKLQPYVQSSVASRSSNKVSFRFFRSFTITQKIGSVAYRLLLPPYSSIHPVFHVSQLKKAVSPSHSVSPSLPDITDELQVPIAFLDRRLHRLRDKTVPQLWIHWSNSPPTLATWEDEITVKQQFPRAPA